SCGSCRCRSRGTSLGRLAGACSFYRSVSLGDGCAFSGRLGLRLRCLCCGRCHRLLSLACAFWSCFSNSGRTDLLGRDCRCRACSSGGNLTISYLSWAGVVTFWLLPSRWGTAGLFATCVTLAPFATVTTAAIAATTLFTLGSGLFRSFVGCCYGCGCHSFGLLADLRLLYLTHSIPIAWAAWTAELLIDDLAFACRYG